MGRLLLIMEINVTARAADAAGTSTVHFLSSHFLAECWIKQQQLRYQLCNKVSTKKNRMTKFDKQD